MYPINRALSPAIRSGRPDGPVSDRVSVSMLRIEQMLWIEPDNEKGCVYEESVDSAVSVRANAELPRLICPELFIQVNKTLPFTGIRPLYGVAAKGLGTAIPEVIRCKAIDVA